MMDTTDNHVARLSDIAEVYADMAANETDADTAQSHRDDAVALRAAAKAMSDLPELLKARRLLVQADKTIIWESEPGLSRAFAEEVDEIVRATEKDT